MKKEENKFNIGDEVIYLSDPKGGVYIVTGMRGIGDRFEYIIKARNYGVEYGNVEESSLEPVTFN